jgi:protein-tyrosine phosphatase
MDFSYITPNLWVGPNPDEAADFEELKSRGIDAILSLQSPEDVEDAGRERSLAESAGIEFRNVPVIDFDSVDLKEQLPCCVKVLDELIQQSRRVYVHCTLGMSRSPTVVAAYLHWHRDWPLEKAIDCLKDARECYPHDGAIREAKRE